MLASPQYSLDLRDPIAFRRTKSIVRCRVSPKPHARIACPNPATALNQFAQLQNLIRLYDVLRAQLHRLLDFGPLIFAQDLRHFKSQNVGAYVNCSGAMLPGH